MILVSRNGIIQQGITRVNRSCYNVKVGKKLIIGDWSVLNCVFKHRKDADLSEASSLIEPCYRRLTQNVITSFCPSIKAAFAPNNNHVRSALGWRHDNYEVTQ